MAGRGPAPKADGRRRRNQEPAADELPAEGHTGAYPELPPTYRAGTVQGKKKDGTPGPERAVRRKFLPETRAWYEVWATSPMATRFTAPTWQRLLRLARLVDLYEREPDKGLLGEIRLQEASLGATPADMLRLRWKVAATADERPALAAVASIAGGRRRHAVDPADAADSTGG
jgi:hypothetical protein